MSNSTSQFRKLKHRFRKIGGKPLTKTTRRNIKRSCFFTAQSNTKMSSFPSLRVHSQHESTNITCKPNCAPGGTLRKTRLSSCSGGILAGCTGECCRAAQARHWPGTRDTWRDPLASWILGGIHWRAALVGYSAGSNYSGGILGGIHWRATLGYSAGYSAGCGIHWHAFQPLFPSPNGCTSFGGTIQFLGSLVRGEPTRPTRFWLSQCSITDMSICLFH